jgi:hypothetical protein
MALLMYIYGTEKYDYSYTVFVSRYTNSSHGLVNYFTQPTDGSVWKIFRDTDWMCHNCYIVYISKLNCIIIVVQK